MAINQGIRGQIKYHVSVKTSINFFFSFFKCLADTCPIFWATGTPVLDF